MAIVSAGFNDDKNTVDFFCKSNESIFWILSRNISEENCMDTERVDNTIPAVLDGFSVDSVCRWLCKYCIPNTIKILINHSSMDFENKDILEMHSKSIRSPDKYVKKSFRSKSVQLRRSTPSFNLHISPVIIFFFDLLLKRHARRVDSKLDNDKTDLKNNSHFFFHQSIFNNKKAASVKEKKRTETFEVPLLSPKKSAESTRVEQMYPHDQLLFRVDSNKASHNYQTNEQNVELKKDAKEFRSETDIDHESNAFMVSNIFKINCKEGEFCDTRYLQLRNNCFMDQVDVKTMNGIEKTEANKDLAHSETRTPSAGSSNGNVFTIDGYTTDIEYQEKKKENAAQYSSSGSNKCDSFSLVEDSPKSSSSCVIYGEGVVFYPALENIEKCDNIYKTVPQATTSESLEYFRNLALDRDIENSNRQVNINSFAVCDSGFHNCSSLISDASSDLARRADLNFQRVLSENNDFETKFEDKNKIKTTQNYCNVPNRVLNLENCFNKTSKGFYNNYIKENDASSTPKFRTCSFGRSKSCGSDEFNTYITFKALSTATKLHMSSQGIEVKFLNRSKSVPITMRELSTVDATFQKGVYSTESALLDNKAEFKSDSKFENSRKHLENTKTLNIHSSAADISTSTMSTSDIMAFENNEMQIKTELSKHDLKSLNGYNNSFRRQHDSLYSETKFCDAFPNKLKISGCTLQNNIETENLKEECHENIEVIESVAEGTDVEIPCVGFQQSIFVQEFNETVAPSDSNTSEQNKNFPLEINTEFFQNSSYKWDSGKIEMSQFNDPDANSFEGYICDEDELMETETRFDPADETDVVQNIECISDRNLNADNYASQLSLREANGADVEIQCEKSEFENYSNLTPESCYSSDENSDDVITGDQVELLSDPDVFLCGRPVLVLDLDETLIHASDDEDAAIDEDAAAGLTKFHPELGDFRVIVDYERYNRREMKDRLRREQMRKIALQNGGFSCIADNLDSKHRKREHGCDEACTDIVKHEKFLENQENCTTCVKSADMCESGERSSSESSSDLCLTSSARTPGGFSLLPPSSIRRGRRAKNVRISSTNSISSGYVSRRTPVVTRMRNSRSFKGDGENSTESASKKLRTEDEAASPGDYDAETMGKPGTSPRTVRIYARPHLKDFLKVVSETFEVVVFTAGVEPYATAVLDTLDPEAKFIHHLLHRKHCTKVLNSVVGNRSENIENGVNSTMDYSCVFTEGKSLENNEVLLDKSFNDSVKFAHSDFDTSQIFADKCRQSSSSGALGLLSSHNQLIETLYPHDFSYVKDLSLLNRPLNRIVIMDNSPTCYLFQPRNSIPCSSWLGNNREDDELLVFLPMLRHIGKDENVYTTLDRFHKMMHKILQEQTHLQEAKIPHTIVEKKREENDEHTVEAAEIHTSFGL